MTNAVWDAVVVGAGPSGSSAAMHLAASGYRVVLLERSAFPRDKSCGDGITRSGVQLLSEMGVLDHLPSAWTIRGVRVDMRGQGRREFQFPLERYPGTEALVVPRLVLDEAICRRAVAAGAELVEHVDVREPIIEDGVVIGVRASTRNAPEREFRGRVVIAADGANSRLARKTGLRGPSGPEIGAAIRGYYTDIDGLDDAYEFYLLLSDESERAVLPSYGWVFPTGPKTANIGVGLFERTSGVNLRWLMERFVASLVGEDPRFAAMRATGTWLGAPLRFDFSPDQSARPGLMLVGDAAGLVSPFTGEGISYGLESGRIAADISRRWFERHADRSAPPSEEYALALAQRFAGYFETGRAAGARYRLVWKTLRSTFRSERALHRMCRRVILIPDGFDQPGPGELLEDIEPLLRRTGLDIQRPMMRVAELLTSTVRRDWPFLARMSSGRIDPSSLPLRPSLLLLVCAHFGSAKAPLLPEAGAAIELGYLAFLAHSGIDDGGAAWGNTFSVLVGEFLLAKAYELAGRVGADMTLQLSEAVSAAMRGRVRDRRIGLKRTEEDALASLETTVAELGALPCRLGAALGGATPATQDAVARCGRAIAMAHAVADEVRSYESTEDPLGELVTSDLDDGVYGLPILRALRADTPVAAALAAELARRPVDRLAIGRHLRDANVLDTARAESARYANDAVLALACMPPSPARRALESIARYAVDRRLPHGGDPRAMLEGMTP